MKIRPFSPAHFALAIAAFLVIYGAFYLMCVILANIYL